MWLKIFLAVAIGALTLWPIIDNNFRDATIDGSFFRQITGKGWVLAAIGFFTIVASVWIIRAEENENTTLVGTINNISSSLEESRKENEGLRNNVNNISNELSDIKKALADSKLNYDSVSKTIIDNRQYSGISGGVNIFDSNNTNIIGSTFSQTTVTSEPLISAIATQEDIIEYVKQEMKKNNITNILVRLIPIADTNAGGNTAAIAAILKRTGYNVQIGIAVKFEKSIARKGISVNVSEGILYLIVGELKQ